MIYDIVYVQIALETEAVGAQVLGDLHSQRTTLSHARDRVSTLLSTGYGIQSFCYF